MSQITTCPSCSTRFRVVADQLRISDGWVRCGQCQEVFDARNHLNAPAAAPVATAVAAPVAESTPAPAEPNAAPPTQMASATTQASSPPVTQAARVVDERMVVSPSAMPSVGSSPVEQVQPAALSAQAVGAAPMGSAHAASQPAAPPPGYELPAPEWSDDIDFSEYQAGVVETEVLFSVAPSAVIAPVARAPMAPPESVFTKVLPPQQSADVAATVAPPRSTEPVWNAAARAPSVAKDAFPPLDVSLLKVKTPLPVTERTVPSEATEDLSVIGSPGNEGEIDKLLINEQQTPAAAASGFTQEPALAALDSHLQGGLRSTPSRRAAGVGAATKERDGDTGLSTLPQDEIETIAQKLAQTQPDAVLTAQPTDASSAFARTDWGDEVGDALDSSLEPSFVREARRKAWWQKPLVRVAMGAGVVVLPVALALQVALHERNALASWQPSARPALEFMCTALQCKLAPRQQIRAMVVTGSAFTKAEAERSYQLSLSVQNQAGTPVGVPAVELTLTDSQDQAIARKVIHAKELGAPTELAAGSEWSGTVPVTTEGLNLQVAGYRVLLFYP